MTKQDLPTPGPRYFQGVEDVPSNLESPSGNVRDTLDRPLRDLRISVTDRCNFRCVYCMPKEIFGRDYAFLPKADLLSFEEITRLVKIAASHGVEKIRLTGGEPLLRKNIEQLIEMIAGVKTVDGKDLDIALTTNGSVLAHKAQSLKDAGLQRVTVSLDSLDDERFKAMNDVDFPVSRVLDAIKVADGVGLGPIKINTVVKRGQNDQDIVDIARHFKDSPFIVRFIEYMDVGTTNGWKMEEVVPSAEVVSRIDAEMPLEEVSPNYTGEVSARWRYKDGGGEIGVISSVTQAFCSTCTRVRISTEGKLFTCLFASDGHDLRALMRGGCSDAELETVMAHLWRARTDRYSELRSANTALPKRDKIEMSYIGG
ncbi:MAG TPA: GTP 3',8-cyclase MoaA [Arthrobacter sp.]|nr:GTP 3',8-cyclase MoaA [Arthrobacter sp.]